MDPTTVSTLTRDWLTHVRLRFLREDDLPALEWDGAYTHFRHVYREAYLASLKGQALLWVADHETAGIIGQAFIQLASSRQNWPMGSTVLTFMVFASNPPIAMPAWVLLCSPQLLMT